MTRRRPGWALIEFALGLPLLLGVMLGSVAIGRVLWCERAVQGLASDAARVGALGSSPTDASSRASAHEWANWPPTPAWTLVAYRLRLTPAHLAEAGGSSSRHATRR